MKSSIGENASSVGNSIGGFLMIAVGFLEDHWMTVIGAVQFVSGFLLMLYFQRRKDLREQDAAERAARIAAQQEHLNALAIREKETQQVIADLRLKGIERRGSLTNDVRRIVQEQA